VLEVPFLPFIVHPRLVPTLDRCQTNVSCPGWGKKPTMESVTDKLPFKVWQLADL
jgi:hypothetical protein